MIKLTSTQPHGREPMIHIEGRLDTESVHQLEGCLAGIGAPGRTTLDVSGLASLDATGRAALIRLQHAGHRIVGASLYIHRILEEAQS